MTERIESIESIESIKDMETATTVVQPIKPYQNCQVIIANEHDFNIISPPELPWYDRDSLVQHLVFSMYIKEVWKRGEAVIEGIYARKRNKKRLLLNKMLRLVVRTIRRFARFEMLRSSLEGLLFVQVAYLNSPNELPFMIKGVGSDLTLPQVYFNTNQWEIYKYDKEVEFDKEEKVTETDVAHLLVYFGLLEYMIKEVRSYLLKHVRGHSYWKWKQRALRHMSSVQKSQRYVTATLLEYLNNYTRDEDAVDVSDDAAISVVNAT